MGIASISKLKEKLNYKEWQNAIQGFCKINEYWRYMFEQIPQLTSSQAKKAASMTFAIQETFNAKLIKWLTITNSIC